MQALTWACALLCLATALSPGSAEGATMTVGHANADITGADNAAIQQAVDAVAEQGGGEVVVRAGEYVLHNSVFLRSRVTLRGEGEAILRKDAGLARPVTSDCGFGYDRVKVADPGEWQVGWGVTIKDDRNAGGFDANVRTIAAIEGDDLVLDEDVTEDYCVERNALVQHTFPCVAGLYCERAAVVNIICDGNREENPGLDGCRGGAIYLFKSPHCTIRDCTGRQFSGDGISFQVSPYATVSGCRATGNAGLGLHPGSGSHHSRISDCEASDNGSDGLYLCWRVAFSRFERNRIHDNAGHGISIGHKDTDNVFVENTIEQNAGCAVYFRPEPAYNAGHRCTFRNNRFANNSGPDSAAIRIEGATTGTRFEGNTIADTRGRNAPPVAFYIGPEASDVVAHGNRVEGFAGLVRSDSTSTDLRIDP